MGEAVEEEREGIQGEVGGRRAAHNMACMLPVTARSAAASSR